VNKEDFLIKLRQYWIENTVPNVSDVNVKFLRDLIKISGTKKMLEIWTANWFSAINFAYELEKVNWELITIDFSSKSYEEALVNFKEAQVEKTIKAILGNALDEIPKLENNYFDFVFIDGMMRRSKDFLELSLPKLKKGGIIIIDDVIKFKAKMVWLWEYLEEKKISYNVLPIDKDDGVMMIIKWWNKENI
jgi:predicted O-methyltransferase YrrM